MRKIYLILIYLLDVGIVGFSFLLLAYYRTGTRVIIREYARPLIAFLVIWSIVSLISSKYQLAKKKGWADILVKTIKANFTALGIVLILVFFFKQFVYSRYIVFGTIGIASIIEVIVLTSIYYTFQFQKLFRENGGGGLVTKSPVLEKQQAGKFYQMDEGKDKFAERIYAPQFEGFDLSDAIMVDLWGKYFKDNPQLFNFINEHIDLTRFAKTNTLVLDGTSLFNIEHIDRNSQQLFVNIHKINNFRRINKYFIKVNENLRQGGVFICCGETVNQRYKRFLRSVGKALGNVFYFADFLFRRVCPKIVFLQGMYFFVTKGRNRTLSETEILGRLYYCGFENIEYKEIDGIMYFIVKKVKEPAVDVNPSYGPLIKLRRVGKEGRLFYCYKIRTMHPYSEYLQEYVFNRCRVSDSGKFAGDFRVTAWGRVMRQYWIDELPQFINLFKGDVSIIGARALSRHYFEQYPEDLKEMRLRLKPGLIPVYTADRARSLVELIESERRYLNKKLNGGGVVFDCVYLSRALWNIATRQAKSLDNYAEGS